ncbi:aminotransferase class V-fold PLP-dependent enzyme [Gammaproteobacteria bacterium]|nr:aminotransferase class V-fold PLP-dependent enzyme [Gammaproteobacteria bacterium]
MKQYLDFNATTPVFLESAELIKKFLVEDFGNAGSRTHQSGTDAKKAVAETRRLIASSMDSDESELIFTSGATESNNIALFGLIENAKKANKNKVVTTLIEHKAVLDPLTEASKQDIEVVYVKPNSDGMVETDSIKEALDSKTFLVSCMHANNETGVINPIDEIADEIKSFDPTIMFHTDCAQTFGKTNLSLKNQNIDLISFSGHKFHGPKGIGGLLMRKQNGFSLPITPRYFGGGQERGIRPGTLPVPLIVGMGKSFEICSKQQDDWHSKCREIKQSALKALSELDHKIYGYQDDRCLPNTLSIALGGLTADALIIILKDVAELSTGSACTSEAFTPSHVLTAMGASDSEAKRVARFSWGPDTDPNIFKDIASVIKETL